MHRVEKGLMRRGQVVGGTWWLILLSLCSVGAVYVVNDPAASTPEYCTLFLHQVRVKPHIFIHTSRGVQPIGARRT